jgi:hypothetical protein
MNENAPTAAPSHGPEVAPDRPADAPGTITTVRPRSKCGGVDKQGAPCRGNATTDGYCPHHSPKHSAAMVVARQAGGARTAALVKAASTYGLDLTPDLDSAAGMRSVLAQVVRATAAGKLSSAAADSITKAVRASIELAEVEVAAQLALMKDQLAQLERDRGR